MIGRRCDSTEAVFNGHAGDYCLKATTLAFRTPNDLFAIISIAKGWKFADRGDAGVSVSPSIEIDAGQLGYYHGFLKLGVWNTIEQCGRGDRA